MSPGPRSRARRRRDAEHRLTHDIDIWVASASPDGNPDGHGVPYLVLPRERGDRSAARTGFDLRALTASYRWFRVTPRRVQAWREANEIPGRDLMRGGLWLA